jgi:hypothetical protein
MSDVVFIAVFLLIFIAVFVWIIMGAKEEKERKYGSPDDLAPGSRFRERSRNLYKGSKGDPAPSNGEGGESK